MRVSRVGFAAFWSVLAAASAARAETAFDLEPGTTILPPVTYGQLAVFPIVKSDAAPADKHEYLSFSDGLKEKLVKVTEVEGGGQVNQVNVSNSSAKPLLLLGGEVILGGQQDRIIGQDTIVPAGKTRGVQVFCVEHGRWSGGHSFGSGGTIAEGKVRMSAKFKQDQSAVWAEVASRNQSLGAGSTTGTYRKLATGPEGEKATKPYQENIAASLDKLPQAKKIVGVAIAISGRVVSVDVFDSPELFARYKEGLLHSAFVSAAATTVPASAVAMAPPAPAAVNDFVKTAEAAPEQTIETADKARVAVKRAAKVAGSSVMATEGKRETSVYRSYQAEE